MYLLKPPLGDSRVEQILIIKVPVTVHSLSRGALQNPEPQLPGAGVFKPGTHFGAFLPYQADNAFTKESGISGGSVVYV